MISFLLIGALQMAMVFHPMSQTTTEPRGSSLIHYEGRLIVDDQLVNDDCDFWFELWDSPTGGNQITGLRPGPWEVQVVDGCFAVDLDFGSDAQQSLDGWLGIGLCCSSPCDTALAAPMRLPVSGMMHSSCEWNGRQDLLLIDTESASLSVNSIDTQHDLDVEQAPGPQVCTSTDDLATETVISPTDLDFYTDSVNAGSCVLGNRVLRLEGLRADGSVISSNVIGGWRFNSVTNGAVAATVFGGAGNFEVFPPPNRVTDTAGTVSGGVSNQAGDGAGTTRDRVSATVGGGESNISSGGRSTISGGFVNRAVGDFATIGGGGFNVAKGKFASMAGGGGAATGQGNLVSDDFGTIGGGSGNHAGDNSPVTTDATFATVGGGQLNVSSKSYATVSGGRSNAAGGMASAIVGGQSNVASGEFSIIGGGRSNRTTAAFGTIGGGGDTQTGQILPGNAVTDDFGTIGGGGGNLAGDDDANTSSAVYATIGGGKANTATASYATIAGGGEAKIGHPETANRVTDQWGTVCGGGDNQAGNDTGLPTDTPTDASFATVGGGRSNEAFGPFSTIGGGAYNHTAASCTTIAGGCNSSTGDMTQLASDNFGTIGGGGGNRVGNGNAIFNDAPYGTVSGGEENSARASHATVPGGRQNVASGDYSFAAGRRALAAHNGVFVWADSKNLSFPAPGDVTFPNQADGFFVRATGGMVFASAVNAVGNTTAGVRLAPGGGAWLTVSDRSAKQNVTPIDSRQVLEKVAAMDIATWNYTSQPSTIRHIGPMAQDFHRLFEVGEDARFLNGLDVDGVALAAIQGLYAKLQEKDARIDELCKTTAALQERVASLEAGLTRQASSED